MLEIKGKYCKDVKVFTDNIEEMALSQIYAISEHRAYDGKKIRIMPDVHAGKNCVIGFSMPIDIDNDYIDVGAIGCDIGCTVSAAFFNVPMPNDKIVEFEHKIRKVIPFGVNINAKLKITPKEILSEFNRVLNRLCSMYPQFSEYRMPMNCENDLEAWCKRIRMDYGTFLKSLGSVGGGNHYVEYDVNEENQTYCVSVHCGSRNLGLKVFNYWNNIAKSLTISKDELRAITEAAKSKTSDKKKYKEVIAAAREEYLKTRMPGYLNGENLYGYLIDVCLAQEYARLNHEVIIKQIAEIYGKLSNGGKMCDEIHTTHNYIDYDFKALMGKPNMMVRKGAVRAYEGERLVIPFNMRDGIAICQGKSNEDWNYTAPHGCGRLYSRSKSKEILDVEEFKKQMSDSGIYTTTADKSTLDEAPNAYKSYKEILELIEPTVEVLYLMKPKMNIKSAES